MNKKTVSKLFLDEIERLNKNISLVEKLDTKKTYKIFYSIKEASLDEGTNKYTSKIIDTVSFIGKLKSFNKESVRLVALGIQKVKGTPFQWELARFEKYSGLEKSGDAKFEISMPFDIIESIQEWENLETPQLEAAFIVNYEYVSPELKQRCFNIK